MNLLVMTELDEAGLADVGWQIRDAAPVVPDIPMLAATRNQITGNVTLAWSAIPSQTYQVQELRNTSWQNLVVKAMFFG